MIKRSFLVRIHLLAAAFFTPALVMVALSGGLYLMGVKGNITRAPVALPGEFSLDPASATLEKDVRVLLSQLDADFDFDYLKVSGNTLITRPTSSAHYEFTIRPSGIEANYNRPDFVKAMVELHKGHGPLMYRDFQKAMAFTLLFVLITGTWLGLSAKPLRSSALAALGSGLAIFLAMVLAP